jgi:drug/metabolite transporter (DMT)-like permease
MTLRRPYLPDLYLILAAVLWGSDYPFAKIGLGEISPLAFSAARTLLAAGALVPFFVRQQSSRRVSRRDWVSLGLLACCGVFVSRICWSVGLTLSTASNAALLMTSSPMFGLVTSFFVSPSAVTRRATLGLLIGLGGVVTVLHGDVKGWSWSEEHLLGNLILLAAAISWAVFTVLAARVLSHYSSLTVTTYVMVIGSVLFVPFVQNTRPGGWGAVSSLGWFSVVYVGLSGNCLAYFLWMKGIATVGPVRTILYFYLVPITAIASSVMVLGEGVTSTQICGGLIVGLAVLVARSE